MEKLVDLLIENGLEEVHRGVGFRNWESIKNGIAVRHWIDHPQYDQFAIYRCDPNDGYWTMTAETDQVEKMIEYVKKELTLSGIDRMPNDLIK